MALKTPEAATEYLRGCLEGIPASWWADFLGFSVSKILQEIKVDSKDCILSRGYLRRKTTSQIFRGSAPTRWRFLAAWLTYGRKGSCDWVKKSVRENGLGGAACWHDSDSPPPAADAGEEAWDCWFEAIHGRLWPDEESLRRVLAPAQLEFRRAVLGIQALRVTPEGIVWKIPSFDIGQHSSILKEHFTMLVAQGRMTTAGDARDENGSLLRKDDGATQTEEDTPVTTRVQERLSSHVQPFGPKASNRPLGEAPQPIVQTQARQNQPPHGAAPTCESGENSSQVASPVTPERPQKRARQSYAWTQAHKPVIEAQTHGQQPLGNPRPHVARKSKDARMSNLSDSSNSSESSSPSSSSDLSCSGESNAGNHILNQHGSSVTHNSLAGNVPSPSVASLLPASTHVTTLGGREAGTPTQPSQATHALPRSQNQGPIPTAVDHHRDTSCTRATGSDKPTYRPNAQENTAVVRDLQLKVLGVESLILVVERDITRAWEQQKRLRDQEVRAGGLKHKTLLLSTGKTDCSEVGDIKRRIQAMVDGVIKDLFEWRARERQLVEEKRQLEDERRGLLDVLYELENGQVGDDTVHCGV